MKVKTRMHMASRPETFFSHDKLNQLESTFVKTLEQTHNEILWSFSLHYLSFIKRFQMPFRERGLVNDLLTKSSRGEKTNAITNQKRDAPRISHSFGDYGRGHPFLQRYHKNRPVERIYHRGYLMKRSNEPTEGYEHQQFDTDSYKNEGLGGLSDDEDLETLFASPLAAVLSAPKQNTQQTIDRPLNDASNKSVFRWNQTPQRYSKSVSSDEDENTLDANSLSQKTKTSGRTVGHGFSNPIRITQQDSDANRQNCLALSSTFNHKDQKNDSINNHSILLATNNDCVSESSEELQFDNLIESPLIPLVDQSTEQRRMQSPSTVPCECVDPRDGHVWRNKFCVLEEGVLYFYKNERDADLPEAQAERSRDQPSDQLTSSTLTATSNDEKSMILPPSSAMDLKINKISSKAEYLSKSPMPRKMQLLPNNFDYVLNKKSLNVSSSWKSGHAMNRPNVPNKFMRQHEFIAETMDPIWEKRVSLHDVGAVRTTEEELGENSFVLMTSDEDSLLGGHNCLVLKASTIKERDEWLLLFHSALASAMRHIFKVLTSDRVVDGTSNSRQPISSDFQSPPMSPLSPSSSRVDESAVNKTKLLGSPFAAKSPYSNQVLSHGHGRSDLNRRRIREQQSFPNYACRPRSSSVELNLLRAPELPLPPTTTSSLQLEFSDAENDSLSKETSIQTNMLIEGAALPLVPSLTTITSNSSLLHLALSDHATMDGTGTQETEAKNSGPPKIPFYLQNAKLTQVGECKQAKSDLLKVGEAVVASATPRKWIPRWKLEAMKRQNECSTLIENSTRPLQQLEVTHSMLNDSETRESDREPSDDNIPRMKPIIQLGGCAHTDFGSILEEQNTNRKILKGDSIAFGGIGGGIRNDSRFNSFDLETVRLPLEWEVGAFSGIGIRDSNEDAFLICEDLMRACSKESLKTSKNIPESHKMEKIGLFAIFDGHCGSQAARYASEFLPLRLHDALITNHLKNVTRHEDESNVKFDENTLEGSLSHTIQTIDLEFCRLSREDAKRNWESGATALVVLLTGSCLMVANLGDSRGVLSASGTPDISHFADNVDWNVLERASGDQIGVFGKENVCCFWKELCEVHSPSRSDERKRIEAANGWVTVEKEVCFAQAKRVDFCDEDVVNILKKYYSDRVDIEESNDSFSDEDSSIPVPKSKLEGRGKRNVAPGRLMEITRTCGELAVSRAIGDRDFKASFNKTSKSNMQECSSGWWEGPSFFMYDLDHSREFKGDLVTAEPELQTHAVGAEGVTQEFLVIACDGLWDVIDSDDVVRITRSLLYEKKWSAKKAVSPLRFYS